MRRIHEFGHALRDKRCAAGAIPLRGYYCVTKLAKLALEPWRQFLVEAFDTVKVDVRIVDVTSSKEDQAIASYSSPRSERIFASRGSHGLRAPGGRPGPLAART